jgi:hypothetical protein
MKKSPQTSRKKVRKMKKITASLVSISFAIALSGCGGGGGGSSSATPNAVGIGAWQGTSSTGYIVDNLVLPTGHFYAIFGNTNSNGGLGVVGFDSGTYSVSGNNIGANLAEYVYTGAYLTGTLAGTVTTGTSITGTASYSNNQTSTFSLTPYTTSSYNFNTAANLTSIAGNWSGSVLNGTATTATISSGGAVTVSNSGCTYSGTATPSTSNYNYFDVSVTSGNQVGCGYLNTTYIGAGISYPLSNGHTQLLVIVENTASHTGTVFFGIR